MKPYHFLALKLWIITCLVCIATNPAIAAGKRLTKAVKSPITAVSGKRLFTSDPLTKSGTAHLYNLEYDEAISDFEAALKVHPDDPFAVNHLIQALLFKELYRLDALDTTLYTDNGFLTGKPLAGDPEVKERIFSLAERGVELSQNRLRKNPDDVEALYARGVTRGLKLTYVAIIEKSFFSALKNASSSRRDHERVLRLDPNYIDAKTLVGIHNFVVGSMPLAARIMAGIVGMSGSKEKGLRYLYEVANTDCETSVDARVTLVLFLRREASYQDALTIARSLREKYPKNFIFALEEANVLKDAGRGPEAILAYRKILANAKKGMYADPHLDRAEYGLAEALKGQRRIQEALREYEAAGDFANPGSGVKLRALLSAGEMYDALGDRKSAIKDYGATIALDGDSSQAELARKFMRQPFVF